MDTLKFFGFYFFFFGFAYYYARKAHLNFTVCRYPEP